MAKMTPDNTAEGRAPIAPLMIFRPISREQRLKSLLKPVRPAGKLPGR